MFSFKVCSLFIQFLLTFNLYGQIRTATNVISIPGKVNFRNGVRAFRMVKKIGLILCSKRCRRLGKCDALNYERSSLQCELVKSGATSDELESSVGWTFISKQDLDQLSTEESSCEGKKKLIVLKSGQPVCATSPTTEYPDCRDTPGPGIYYIQMSSDINVQAKCEDNNWMIFQHRKSNSGSHFKKNWIEYKRGFGEVEGEYYWLGNENIHLYTSKGPCEIKVELETGNGTYTAKYSTFAVENENAKYRLTVTGYSGNTGDSFNYPGKPLWSANGKRFSTPDQDNDDWPGGQCARSIGWWMSWCSANNLNSMTWMTLKQTVLSSKVMVRRK